MLRIVSAALKEPGCQSIAEMTERLEVSGGRPTNESKPQKRRNGTPSSLRSRMRPRAERPVKTPNSSAHKSKTEHTQDSSACSSLRRLSYVDFTAEEGAMVRDLLLNAQRSQSVHGTEPALHAAASACVTMRLALRAPSGGNGCLTAAWRPGCVCSASSGHRDGMVSAAAPDICVGWSSQAANSCNGARV